MSVSDRTKRRWVADLVNVAGCHREEARRLAEAWEGYDTRGGVGLRNCLAAFRSAGYSDAEAADWWNSGLAELEFADLYRSRGVGHVAAGALFRVGWRDDQDAVQGFVDYGAPLGLIALIIYAGSEDVVDIDECLARWRQGEDVEPALRLLAALRDPPEPVPAPEDPPMFPLSGWLQS